MALRGSDMPQARSLDRIREVVQAAETGPVTAEMVTKRTGLSLRHAGYHIRAAILLGWMSQEADQYAVTAKGQRLLATTEGSSDEAQAFADALRSNEPIAAVAPSILAPAAPGLGEVTNSIRRLTSLAYSTAEARAQTLFAWRRRILPALVETTQLSFPLVTPSDDPTAVLKSVTYQDWKSFRSATLSVDELTILIGTNASGKSNALDGLEFLRRTAAGEDIRAALSGGPQLPTLRGGLEWAARSSCLQFTLCAVIASAEDNVEYEYAITVDTSKIVALHSEKLERLKYGRGSGGKPGALASRIALFRTDEAPADSPSLTARLYNEKSGTKRDIGRSQSMLSQMAVQGTRAEIADGVRAVRNALTSIFVLDPIPSKMRDYAPLSEALAPDASNVAGVLAALTDARRAEVEALMTYYVRRLPERDIERVYAERVGKFGSDAMLYCRERWLPTSRPLEIDARGMSDGTLRFVAILAALLTRPSGSVLVVEEIDNGLHPSRAQLLLELLSVVGQRRKVDVIVTTHNQALLDSLAPNMLPFVVVANRQTADGSSALTVLEDVKQLPKLLAMGSIGRAAATGTLEKALAPSPESDAK